MNPASAKTVSCNQTTEWDGECRTYWPAKGLHAGLREKMYNDERKMTIVHSREVVTHGNASGTATEKTDK